MKPHVLTKEYKNIIVSDDPRVHTIGNKIEGIDKVIYLEKMESFFNVSNEVIKILEEVNEWLDFVDGKNKNNKKILYWLKHCEGGITTQRIQDSLLLLNSYRDLIESYTPSKILMIGSYFNWEDKLLFEYAKYLKLKINKVGSNWVNNFILHVYIKLRPIIKEIYLIIIIVISRLKNFKKNEISIDSNTTILLQLCSPERKHLRNCLPLIDALNGVGLKGVIFSWRSIGLSKFIKIPSNTIIELETKVRFIDILFSIKYAIVSYMNAMIFSNLFLNLSGPSKNFDSTRILIKKILFESIKFFILGEVADRYRFVMVTTRFFKKNRPAAARLWTRVLFYGVAAYRAFHPNKLPLLFWQPSPDYKIPFPYKNYQYSPDIIYASSKEHKKILENDDDSNKIIVTGLPWLSEVEKFSKEHSPASSRRILNITKNSIIFLLDTGYIIRGYLTPREQYSVIFLLLELMNKNKECFLIIKPHPNHTSGILEELILEHSCKNVMLIDKADSPYHAINASDVLITKYSTLALEAMILRKPTICSILDGESKFACFDDAVEYFFNICELRIFLDKIIHSRNYFDEWTTNVIEKSQLYLTKYRIDTVQDSDEIIANDLQRRLFNNKFPFDI